MKLRISLLLVTLFFCVMGFAQSDDFGIWSSVGVEKKLGKWDLAGEAELRTKENSSLIDRCSLGLSGDYRLSKFLQVGGSYSFIYYNDTEYSDFQPRHRLNAFVKGKYSVGDFTFKLRERVQMTAKDVTDRVKATGKIDNYKANPEYTWRNKLEVGYNIPKFPVNPSLSAETFYSLNNPDGNSFCKLRYTLSFDYKVAKRQTISLFGLYDNRIDEEDSQGRFITGISYKINLR